MTFSGLVKGKYTNPNQKVQHYWTNHSVQIEKKRALRKSYWRNVVDKTEQNSIEYFF